MNLQLHSKKDLPKRHTIHFPSPMRLFGLQLPAQSFLQQSSGTWPEMEMDFQQKPQDGTPKIAKLRYKRLNYGL